MLFESVILASKRTSILKNELQQRDDVLVGHGRLELDRLIKLERNCSRQHEAVPFFSEHFAGQCAHFQKLLIVEERRVNCKCQHLCISVQDLRQTSLILQSGKSK